MEQWRAELYGIRPTDAEYIRKDELAHYGVEGQKWGVRRWQNEDGTLTPEGYVHYYGKSMGKHKLFSTSAKGTEAAQRAKSRNINQALWGLAGGMISTGADMHEDNEITKAQGAKAAIKGSVAQNNYYNRFGNVKKISSVGGRSMYEAAKEGKVSEGTHAEALTLGKEMADNFIKSLNKKTRATLSEDTADELAKYMAEQIETGGLFTEKANEKLNKNLSQYKPYNKDN